MGKQETLGFVLIFLLLMAWVFFNSPTPKPSDTAGHPADSAQVKRSTEAPSLEQSEPKQETAESKAGVFFNRRLSGESRSIIIETEKYRAVLSSKGAVIKTWELKEYKTWDGHPVQLVDYDDGGDYSLLFTTTDGKLINTKDLYFDLNAPNWTKVTLSGDETYTLRFVLPASNGGTLAKTFTFTNGEYLFKTEFEFNGLQNVIANFKYEVVWENGLRGTERNSVDEAMFSYGYAYSGGELTEIDATKFDDSPKKTLTGVVDFVSTKTKYFTVALIPEKGASSGAFLQGTRKHLPDNGAHEVYTVSVEMPFKGLSNEKSSFGVYFGPNEMSQLKKYDVGLEKTMSLGWTFLIRPISEYIFLPLLTFLNSFISNWGLVIIVFSILVKLALHPLTKSQMRSMKKMQQLNPLMQEIREKYKDDPQKMNTQVMNLYREYGVNPAGGCLPLLLQMPILFALYQVFRQAIELRQASFVWWIKDLSVPDNILTLPFHFPIFGFNEVSGLALVMGLTTFLQQKMSPADPRQKSLVYVMPIMLTLLFNLFPAGLNLYYLVFNVLSIGQQWIINKQHANEPLQKVEQKKGRGGFFTKLPSTKDMERMLQQKKKKK